VSAARPKWRTWAAAAAIAAAAVWTVRTLTDRPRTVRVAWLFTHLDRAHLSEIAWTARSPDGRPAWQGSLRYRPGTAPDASEAVELTLARGADHVEVACTFILPASGPLTTKARVVVGSDDRQTIDVGQCCDACRR